MRYLATILFSIILSLNTIASSIAPGACCGNMTEKKMDAESCSKSCCQKPKKNHQPISHQCCQSLTHNQQSYVVNKHKESYTQQIVQKKIKLQKNNFLTFFDQFETLNELKFDYFSFNNLAQPPKLFIQHCSYLI